jgi:hypothetical protein
VSPTRAIFNAKESFADFLGRSVKDAVGISERTRGSFDGVTYPRVMATGVPISIVVACSSISAVSWSCTKYLPTLLHPETTSVSLLAVMEDVAAVKPTR